MDLTINAGRRESLDAVRIVIHGFSAVHTKVVDEVKTEIAARAGVRLRDGAPMFTTKIASNKVQSEVQVFGHAEHLDDPQKKALKRLIEEIIVGAARRHKLRHEFTGVLFMPATAGHS